MHSAVFNFQNVVTWFIKKKKEREKRVKSVVFTHWITEEIYVKVNSLFLHKFLYKALTIKSSRCLPDG